ncbi:hypothetical protein ABTD96_20690, partial [Acinetobacter baumannii]
PATIGTSGDWLIGNPVAQLKTEFNTAVFCGVKGEEALQAALKQLVTAPVFTISGFPHISTAALPISGFPQ